MINIVHWVKKCVSNSDWPLCGFGVVQVYMFVCLWVIYFLTHFLCIWRVGVLVFYCCASDQWVSVFICLCLSKKVHKRPIYDISRLRYRDREALDLYPRRTKEMLVGSLCVSRACLCPRIFPTLPTDGQQGWLRVSRENTCDHTHTHSHTLPPTHNVWSIMWNSTPICSIRERDSNMYTSGRYICVILFEAPDLSLCANCSVSPWQVYVRIISFCFYYVNNIQMGFSHEKTYMI